MNSNSTLTALVKQSKMGRILGEQFMIICTDNS